MAVTHEILSYYKVRINREDCKKCKRCINHCSYDVLSFNGEKILADDFKCVACQRCVVMCPGAAIHIEQNNSYLPPHGNYTRKIRNIIYETMYLVNADIARLGHNHTGGFVIGIFQRRAATGKAAAIIDRNAFRSKSNAGLSAGTVKSEIGQINIDIFILRPVHRRNDIFAAT